MPLDCREACVLPAISQASAFFSEEVNLVSATRKIDSRNTGRLPIDDLERLLNFRRGVKMLDPRSYIFSLLGPFSPSVSFALSLDYSISVKDLFTKTFRYIVCISSDLRILCSVESPKHIEDDTFPCWVPDWRATSESLHNVLHDRNPRSGYRAM